MPIAVTTATLHSGNYGGILVPKVKGGGILFHVTHFLQVIKCFSGLYFAFLVLYKVVVVVIFYGVYFLWGAFILKGREVSIRDEVNEIEGRHELVQYTSAKQRPRVDL